MLSLLSQHGNLGVNLDGMGLSQFPSKPSKTSFGIFIQLFPLLALIHLRQPTIIQSHSGNMGSIGEIISF